MDAPAGPGGALLGPKVGGREVDSGEKRVCDEHQKM